MLAIAPAMPPDLHFEPFVHLAGLTSDAALISWGGFFFRRGARGGTAEGASDLDPDAHMVVDDEELAGLEVSRKDSIGERSRPYGDARVEVRRAGGQLVRDASVRDCNYIWIDGLEPDTSYSYRILVDGRDWLAGERYDWLRRNGRRGLARSNRRYSTEFRTHPAPDVDTPLAFAVIGDFGVGTRTDSDEARRQRALARGLERAADEYGIRLVLTTGDNIYLGEAHTTATGAEDDDWYFTFYQPYRYLLSRIPFYPAIGNHDAGDTEASDDREQLDDNYFLRQRFTDERETGRSSVNPGLFYRFSFGAQIQFVCLDTTRGDEPHERFFESPKHESFLDESFPAGDGPPRWRIPFSHHPVYCAGPSHSNTTEMERVLVPLFERSGVRLVLAGHEHNFQYSQRHGVHYILSGAGGKLRTDPPDRPDRGHTLAWAAEGHFLVVQIDGSRATVHALTATEEGELRPIRLTQVGGARVSLPIRIDA